MAEKVRPIRPDGAEITRELSKQRVDAVKRGRERPRAILGKESPQGELRSFRRVGEPVELGHGIGLDEGAGGLGPGRHFIHAARHIF